MRRFPFFARNWAARAVLGMTLSVGFAAGQSPDYRPLEPRKPHPPAPLVPLLDGVDPAVPVQLEAPPPPIPTRDQRTSVFPVLEIPRLDPRYAAKAAPAYHTEAVQLKTEPLPAELWQCQKPSDEASAAESPMALATDQAVILPEVPQAGVQSATTPSPRESIFGGPAEAPPLRSIVKPEPDPLPIPVPPADLPQPEPPVKLPDLPPLPRSVERAKDDKPRYLPELPHQNPAPPVKPTPADVTAPNRDRPPAFTPAPPPAASQPGLPQGSPSAPAQPSADPYGPVCPTPVLMPGPCGFDFSQVPAHARPLPPLGHFPVPPTGRGYYSLVDVLTGRCRDAAPKIPFNRFGLMPQPFFDVDWRYLDDPQNCERDRLDFSQRMRLGRDLMLSVGGATWGRGTMEQNSRLTRTDNDYLLFRHRAYADLWYRDLARVYVEGIFADSSSQALPPLPIDRTGLDVLNAFVDLKVTEWAGRPAYLRFGRQELLLGSQRLISTLDWANTRQTFDGVRLTRTGKKWDFDAFWLQPVIPNATRFDEADSRQNLFGAWASYRRNKNEVVDFYNLLLDNNNSVVQGGLQRGNFTINTFGSRYAGRDECGLLWDFEGALQIGRQFGTNVLAGMGTAGVGYVSRQLPWTPTVWAYYDFASGTNNPGVVGRNTFNPLFPFGRYYLGWADQVGRQNIQDLNFHLYAYPAHWLTLWAQYHSFWLSSAQDGLYNAAGTLIRRDATGQAGVDVGQEVDLIANFHLSNRADLMLGYSHMFGGEFLRRTAGPNGSVDNQLFFVQYNLRW